MWCGSCYRSADEPDFFVATGDNARTGKGDEDRLVSGWAPRKSDQSRFRAARDGDDLLVSFECDFCVFGKLFDHEPQTTSSKDIYALACIRRINLDAFWSRAADTVRNNTSKMREGLAISKSMGMRGTPLDPGPLPSYDHVGYEVAIQMIVSSLGAGRYSESHKQWETIRRFRACFSNQVRAAGEANSKCLVLADNTGGNYQRLSFDPCGSLWFQRFMVGCSKRMGQDWRPNQAISVKIMHQLLTKAEARAWEDETTLGRQRWVLAGTYFCICFVLSLRSPEGLMADLEGMLKFFGNDIEEVVVPLLGRFKGEHHSKQHLMISVAVTGSGIRIRRWIELSLAVHKIAGRVDGPLFVNERGDQSTTADMNEAFLELMCEIYEENPKLFGLDVTSVADLSEKFNVFRSFRRGSESRAVAMKVSEADRYVVNRWKKKEKAGTGKVSHEIGQHYVDIAMVKESFIRYTTAM
jgi:hypothetical protein